MALRSRGGGGIPKGGTEGERRRVVLGRRIPTGARLGVSRAWFLWPRGDSSLVPNTIEEAACEDVARHGPHNFRVLGHARSKLSGEGYHVRVYGLTTHPTDMSDLESVDGGSGHGGGLTNSPEAR